MRRRTEIRPVEPKVDSEDLRDRHVAYDEGATTSHQSNIKKGTKWNQTEPNGTAFEIAKRKPVRNRSEIGPDRSDLLILDDRTQPNTTKHNRKCTEKLFNPTFRP